MNCKECRNKLLNYLDGQISEENSLRISQHLKICPSCEEYAGYLRQHLDLIEAEKKMEPKPFLYTRVKSRMASTGAQLPKKIWSATLQPALFSILLMIAIFSGIKVGQYFSKPVEFDFISESLTPLVNEMETEPFEIFLIDFSVNTKN